MHVCIYIHLVYIDITYQSRIDIISLCTPWSKFQYPVDCPTAGVGQASQVQERARSGAGKGVMPPKKK